VDRQVLAKRAFCFTVKVLEDNLDKLTGVCQLMLSFVFSFVLFLFLYCVFCFIIPQKSEIEAEQWPWCHMFPMETLPCLGNET